MTPRSHFRWFSILVLLLSTSSSLAGYKARPWNIRALNDYPARLTSEGVTIAIDPLFLDGLAAQVFDKKDMVTRGIMPIAFAIFNDNDFPVQINGASVQLIHPDKRLRTLAPNEVVHRLFSKDGKKAWIPRPIPRPATSEDKLDPLAFEDFDHKFLGRKTVMPRAKAGGFLYFYLPESKDLRAFLSQSRIYLPEISRSDTGAALIYFEIDLDPAVAATPRS